MSRVKSIASDGVCPSVRFASAARSPADGSPADGSLADGSPADGSSGVAASGGGEITRNHESATMIGDQGERNAKRAGCVRIIGAGGLEGRDR